MKAYQKFFRELSSGLSLCDKGVWAPALLLAVLCQNPRGFWRLNTWPEPPERTEPRLQGYTAGLRLDSYLNRRSAILGNFVPSVP
jgi:hypothetical protein